MLGIGYLVPFHVTDVRTRGHSFVEKGDDKTIVCFVHAGHAAARQEPAGQPSKNTHAGLLDTGTRRQV
jgi:hypothetical protein